MKKNKTGKYLKYAIGEIILVVIGILIALQINNWNEYRIEKKNATAYLSEFKKDLKSDTIQFNYMLTLISETIDNELKVLKNRINTEENLDPIWRIMGPVSFRRTINKRTYDNLQNSGRSNLLGYKKLYEKLSYYYTETNRDLEVQTDWDKRGYIQNSELIREFVKEGGYEVSVNSLLENSPELEKYAFTIPMLDEEKKFPILKFINSIPGRNYITENLRRHILMNRTYKKYKDEAEQLISNIDTALETND